MDVFACLVERGTAGREIGDVRGAMAKILMGVPTGGELGESTIKFVVGGRDVHVRIVPSRAPWNPWFSHTSAANDTTFKGRLSDTP